MWRSIVVGALAIGAIAASMLIPAPREGTEAASAPPPLSRDALAQAIVVRPEALSAQPTPSPSPAGTDGAAMDQADAAAADLPPMTVKRILDIPGPIKFGTYYWDTSGVPADGPLIITVDIEAETMSVFRDGYEIGATAILYGMDDKPTPLGVHDIKQKKVHHISNLYHVPMPYMMRLTWDGVAIHAAEVQGGRATHGCIGVPLAFAKLLFGQAKLGDKVIITQGKRLGLGSAVTGA